MPSLSIQIPQNERSFRVNDHVGTKWGLDWLRQEKRVYVLNLLSTANPLFTWCLGPELNRHGGGPPRDFKSLASTNSATQAFSVSCES
jgi:hypothetical protein